MPATLFKNESRGGGNYDWLRTKYSYSFANYYDPSRTGFGALRVVNDDWIAPGAGFPTHAHQDMEIITIPLTGSLAHKDDAGGAGVVSSGMVQVMSAGTGVLHNEFNNSKTEPVELFQIWIEPKTRQVAPRYQEGRYITPGTTGSTLLVGPQTHSNLWIHQEAFVSWIHIPAGKEWAYPLYQKGNGIYMLVMSGEGNVLEYSLEKRDALEIVGESEIVIAAKTALDILCLEVPLE